MTPGLLNLTCAQFALMAFLVGISVNYGHAQTNTPASLVFFQSGTLPILITAPHGGTNEIKGVAVRTNGVVLRDDGTYELALLVNEALTKRMNGKQPYVVAAQFHRKYIDVNRPATNAYESTNATAVYDAYHKLARESVDAIRAKFGGEGLLVDLHGQARDAESIFRGTANGVTVMRLIQKQGETAFTGTNSLLGRLAAKGYAVVPPNTPPGKPPEDRSYNGGFTVRTYGSHNTNGIDAIQLELGSKLRRTDRKKFAEDLAEAVAGFYDTCLATKPPTK